MKKISAVMILIAVFIVFPCFSQSRDFDTFYEGINDFIAGLSTALPFNTTVGLNWSDAYIGQFPHFGFGITAGATGIPLSAVNMAMDMMGVNILNEIPELSYIASTYGFPFPAAVLDLRVGGFLLPFDLGFKLGFLPDEVKELLPPDMQIDYLLIGGDVRFALVQDEEWRPDISIGAGFNYLQGSFLITGLFGSDEEIQNVGGYDITLRDPDFDFSWEAKVIDLKLQISKQLLIITPFIGAGVSFGWANASAGLRSDVLVNGNPITGQQIEEIQESLAYLGKPIPDLSKKGILVNQDIDGWSFRAFGGISLDLLILRIDLGAMYNFSSNSYGITGNVRLQF